MSLYDGMGDDINIAGFKLSNIALKNTPSQNPKSFKTTAEREAKENEGKTSLIINLLDEIDTTLYVINDKLEEAPEIMMGNGMTGGVRLTKEGIYRMKVAELKEELLKRRLNTAGKKKELVARLEQFLLSPENVKDFQPKPEQREMETQTPGSYSLPSPPGGLPLSDEPDTPPPPYPYDEEEEYNRYKRAGDEYEGDYLSISDEDEDEDTISPPPSYSSRENYLDGTNMSSIDGSLLFDNTKLRENDDGSSFNPYQQGRQTPSSRNDLNSNIMRLEEQVNRLSKLTKGLNNFINFSNEVEIEKLDNSYKKVAYSSIDLEEHLKEIDNIDSRFESKINSILNKIDIEYNKIKSALNSYSYTFLEGSGCNSCEGGDFWGDFGTGFKKGFDGTIDSAKKVAEFGVAAAPLLMLAAGRNEKILFNHSSKKRFY
jgi:hypothetical protein